LGAALREDDWKDLFIAWAPSKNVSFTLAYVDLGRIVPGVTRDRRQTGYYLSAQVAF
jgi:mannitol-1-phosphate/altronate dehydrogenase